jgi:hypothetical protein
MTIDECEQYKPKNYAKKIKKTDHNTILLKLQISRGPTVKPTPFVNTRNEVDRNAFKTAVEQSGIDTIFSTDGVDLNSGYERMMDLWDGAMDKSFRKIKPKKAPKSNVTTEVRTLMQQEKQIRLNIADNPERGRAIAEIRKAIKIEIEKERFRKMSEKINMIKQSKSPQGEIFKVRREGKSSEKVGFPLKDTKGRLQVSKDGVDEVICQHFKVVFAQNPIPAGEQWLKYWEEVDCAFQSINVLNDEMQYEEPSIDEIRKLIKAINVKTSVLGTMKGDLIKLVGKPVTNAIHHSRLTAEREGRAPHVKKLSECRRARVKLLS